MTLDGDKLRAMRMKRGLKAQELANLVGVSSQRISALEHGRSLYVHAKTVTSLAKALKCKVLDFCNEGDGY